MAISHCGEALGEAICLCLLPKAPQQDGVVGQLARPFLDIFWPGGERPLKGSAGGVGLRSASESLAQRKFRLGDGEGAINLILLCAGNGESLTRQGHGGVCITFTNGNVHPGCQASEL